MKRTSLIAVLLAAMLTLCFASRALAFPEPSPFPLKDSWQLDFDHGLPKRIVVNIPGQATPQAFWYMTFTVTNNTDNDQLFLPTFDMLGEDGKVIHSDTVDVSKAVFDQIKQVEGIKLLEPMESVRGKLRIGPSQAKDSVAIWPETQSRIGTFSIFVSGLSSETVFMRKVNDQYEEIPKNEHPTDDDGHIVLMKTLQLDYQVPGDEHAIDVKAIAKDETWIMR